MPIFQDTLYTMTGKVRSFRPEIPPNLVEGFLNERIRQAIDEKIYWADLIQRGVLSIPAQYATGTVSVSPGSDLVAGVATAWPVNDLVNTTLSDGVTDLGVAEAAVASLAGIVSDALLVIDAGTPEQEVVPVLATGTGTFTGRFSYNHSAGATVTRSSLAGRQFRISVGTPVFTVRGVLSATSLQLSMPWGGAALAGAAYWICGMYQTLAVDLKTVLAMVDPEQGTGIRLHVTQDELNWKDPQRSTSDQPQELADLGPNECGNMQYEVWPCPLVAYQLPYLYTRQWPEMVNPNDRPPHFINPNVFVYGAIADALRWRRNAADPFFNPALARDYEMKFREGLEGAKNADEAKAQTTLRYMFQALGGPVGASYWINHLDWAEIF